MTRLLAVYDGNDTLRQRFSYADGRMSVTMTNYDATGAEQGTYALAYDQVGTPTAVIDMADGAVVKRLAHDSFGNLLYDSNPTFEIPFAFAESPPRYFPP